MRNDDSWWEKQLDRPPHPTGQKHFTPAMMRNVEQVLQQTSDNPQKSRRPVRRIITACSTALGLLLIILLIQGQLPGVGGADRVASPPTANVPPQEQKLLIGDGGDSQRWSALRVEDDVSAMDRTIIQLVTGLLHKQLGALGGPAVTTDDLWADLTTKQVLSRYELSSPWVTEVYVRHVVEGADKRSYILELTLGDSAQANEPEWLQVDVRLDSALIDSVSLLEGPDADLNKARLLLSETTADNRQVRLYGTVEASGEMIHGMELEISGEEKTYVFEDWRSVTNESYAPVLQMEDVTGDGKADILVMLVTGYGTGDRQTELKVLDGRHWQELAVGDPVAAVKAAVTVTVETKEDQRTYRFRTGNDEYVATYEEAGAGMWFETAAFGNVLAYWTHERVVQADVSVQVSPGHFPLAATVSYAYQDEDQALLPIGVQLRELY